MDRLFLLSVFLCFIAVRCEAFLPGLSPDEILKTPTSYEGASYPDGATVDELIEAAGSRNGAEKAVGKGQRVVEMDMIVDESQYQSTYAGGAMKSEYYRWPQAVIPYQVSSSFANGRDKFIYSAMKEWMEKTCVVFTPAGSELHKKTNHGHKITIFSGGGCYSSVGYNHQDHKVSLSLNGCAYHGTALHELGHTIGLHHEQSRIDRDNALKIVYANVNSGNAYNFHKQTDSDPFGVKYDFCSIMHYGNTAFSSNGKFTILTRNQDYQFSIGNPGSQGHRNALTFTDAKIVNLMYKCNAHCETDAACETPCYVNHKCQCECPKPEDRCPKKSCKDYYSEPGKCQSWKSAGKCNTGNSWMTRNCAQTCGFCAEARRVLGSDEIEGDGNDGGQEVVNPVTPDPHPPVTQEPAKGQLGPNCKDRQANCGPFVDFYRGNCFTDSSEFLRPMCPKACGICLPCQDLDSKCQKWASLGYCYEKGLNDQHIYMADNCKRACGFCI